MRWDLGPTCWSVLDVESERDRCQAVFVLHPALILPGLLSGEGLAPVQGGLTTHLQVAVAAPPGEAGGRLALPLTEDRGDQLSLQHSEAGGGEGNILRGV